VKNNQVGMNAVKAQRHESGEAEKEQQQQQLIVNVTPDQHECGAPVNKRASQPQAQLTTPVSSLIKGPVIREDDSDLLKLAAPRLANSVVSSDHTAPTEASTTALSNLSSYSTIGTDASISTAQTSDNTSTNSRLLFYKTPSQQKLQQELQKIVPTRRSSLTSMLRLDQEEMNEGLEELQVRSSIEAARKSLMRKWSTPYDIDPPRRVRLAKRNLQMSSSRSIATTDTTSSDILSTCTESDPMAMERQIWNAIEALMADAFSADGGESSVCTEDVLPKSLLRAMSHSSLSTSNDGPPSHLTTEEYDEIKMAQAALNAFMDMLLPGQEGKSENGSSAMPSLETMRDSSSQKEKTVDQIAMAEVALNNFMDVLLRDLEDEQKSESEHSSKVQILDIFQWSLRVNVDAQEKIRYLEQERQRLEEERQRELEELKETERRLEQERARRKVEEEKRRKKIRQLEQHLAQEQLALAAANRKAYHAMKRNQYRQPAIPEESNQAWASTGKPVVVKDTVRNLQYDDASMESEDAAMQYIVTSSETSFQKRAPEFEQEGTLPNHASVKRMPSWTMIGEKRIVMASTDSVESSSQTSSVTNHLPSSFHESDAIRNLSDSDSSKRASQRQPFSSGSLGRAMSVASSMDMPDLASIDEDSVLAASIETPPYIATAGEEKRRSYPGGVPRAASGILKAQPSLRHGFERVASSSGRVRLVSASGDVYTDDVSKYSFSKFHAEPVDEGNSRDVNVGSNSPKGRHTKLISVGSAGDIHQIVGSTVRFNEGPDSSDLDEYSSSSSEEVTIDLDLHRDAQTDAKKPVPHVSRRYGSGGKKQRLGGRLKRSIKAVCDRGKCVTNSWFCESANKRYGDISKQSKRLEQHHSTQLEKRASQECLLHSEDDPYDRSHVLEPNRITIDETGFVCEND
jgi:hypothetical protein